MGLGLNTELPPRTRRIHLGGDAVGQKTGTTSAHAENTLLPGRQAGRNRNYLRARGEYKSPRGSGRRLRELPPRTRRIPHSNPPSVSVSGTTSAHAENTMIPTYELAPRRNYLRARGEYFCRSMSYSCYLELPPRTRRIRCVHHAVKNHFGTTSAHAENTCPIQASSRGVGNYLRARGEYGLKTPRSSISWELPPRTRRIPELFF